MFNEAQIASLSIDRIIAVIKKLPLPTILIVIDDGSSDATPHILAKKAKIYKNLLLVLTHKKNKGYGGATQTGINEAIKRHATWILHMDSDLTNDPKYIPRFLKKASENVDCVKASRYIHGSVVKHVPAYRRLISYVGNYMAHFLFGVGIIDCTNGFRLVRTEKMKGLKFKERNFSLILEELYYLKKRNAKFSEIPYTLTARRYSSSHFSYKPQVFLDYFKYAFLSFFVK